MLCLQSGQSGSAFTMTSRDVTASWRHHRRQTESWGFRDVIHSSGRVAMEKTKLLVGGGVSPTGDPMTSAAGAPRDYGGAQQLETISQQPDAGITNICFFIFWSNFIQIILNFIF